MCSGEPLRRVEQLPDVGTAPEGEPVGSEDGQGGLLAAGDLRSVVASALVAQLALEPLPLGDELLRLDRVQVRQRIRVLGVVVACALGRHPSKGA